MLSPSLIRPHHPHLLPIQPPERVAAQPSRLSEIIGASVVDFADIDGCDALVTFPHFTPPRYSTEFLRRAHRASLATSEAPRLYLAPSRIPIRRDVFLRNSLLFSTHQWGRSLTVACEVERREQEEAPSVRPVTFKVVRRKHSAMGKLMSLYAEVTEKMRGDEETDHYANIEELSYKQALCYLRACSRWLTEKKVSRKQARTLNDILSESRTFPN